MVLGNKREFEKIIASSKRV